MEGTAEGHNDDDDDTRDRDLELIRSHAAQLAEHFDAVQIIVTRHDPAGGGGGGTVMADHGEGNWFARYGSVREWVTKHEEIMRQSVRPPD